MSGLVRIRFERWRTAPLLARGVAVVDRVAQEAAAELRELAGLVLGQRLGRVEVERARRGSDASVSSTGRLKASDLPLAVPVVTIVSAPALSRASAWWDQSASIPAAEALRRAQDGCPRGWRGDPAWARSRVVATTSPSAAVSRTASHGYGAWTRLTACHSRTELIRPFHHAQFPLELLRERKRESVTVVLPTREVADTIGPIVERLLSLDG